MMEWTDRHCRYFLRLISKETFLYTEMVTAEAILRGNRERLLGFHPAEHPVALQIGGSDPKTLAVASRIGAELGYDEINLNVGCPSDRVQSGRFGACLMAEPALVADCIAVMGAEAGVPITVKCRIGIDDQDAEESLDRFIDAVAEGGCTTFILHARKAWLQGLSPKENRDVPPIDYGRVYRVKAGRPGLTITDDAGTRPGEHHAAERGRAARRELRQAPARRVHEHVGAGDAGGEAQCRPRGRPRQRHRQRQQGGGGEAAAHECGAVGRAVHADPSAQPRVEGAEQRAEQVAEVVRARQPARARQVDDAVVQHHLQDRREGEAADAHRDGEGGEAGEGDAERGQRLSEARS